MTNSDLPFQPVQPGPASPKRPSSEFLLARANEKKWFSIAFLTLWLAAWTVGGAIAITKLLEPAPSQPKSFLSAWLIAWALGWIGVAFTVVWSVWGMQTMVVGGRAITHVAQIGPFRRVRNFRPEDMTNLRWVDRRRTELPGRWTIEEPSLKFDHGAKTISVFKGISQPEAGRVIEAIGNVFGTARSAS